MKVALFIALAVFAGCFLAVWLRALHRRRSAPTAAGLGIGFATNFFDTLGIGSFAPTAAIYRLTRMVPDERIPGTMNVGHTLPVVVMAYIYIALVDVDTTTLVTLIVAAIGGAWLGADLVSRLPQRPIQLGIGSALVVAAVLMTMAQLECMPLGGEARGLATGPLVGAALASVALGALNTIGVGFYGPCMILIALLGMDPKAAFPIMMGACAFLMPVGSARFVQRDAYDASAALGLTLGGIPAVLVAAFVVESLPLDALRWLVVVVAVYTAALMLRPARR
ncbi:MAG: sulfite exporter TauE/SafE family protein [Planctomycetota bacterium]